MTIAHLKCKNCLGIKVLKFPLFTSEAWDINPEDAQTLVGGEICFHETKRESSYFGGIVRGFQTIKTSNAHSIRVIFTIESTRAAKGKDWEGRNYVNAHFSGVIA